MTAPLTDAPDDRAATAMDAAVTLYAGGRVVLGVVALGAPRLVGRAFGIRDNIEAARYLGARDLVTGAGILLGHRHGRARGWLEAAALIDSLDAVITLMATARGRVPLRRAVLVSLLAAGSAATAATLARSVDEPPATLAGQSPEPSSPSVVPS